MEVGAKFKPQNCKLHTSLKLTQKKNHQESYILPWMLMSLSLFLFNVAATTYKIQPSTMKDVFLKSYGELQIEYIYIYIYIYNLNILR